MNAQTEKTVREIVADRLGLEADGLNCRTGFTADLGIDSLDAVEIQMAIEEAFDIELADDTIGEITTIGDLVNAIGDRRADEAATRAA